MKNNLFEEYLEEYWFRDYHGTKDDAEASFDRWLGGLDTDELIEIANTAMKEQKDRMDYQEDEKRRGVK